LHIPEAKKWWRIGANISNAFSEFNPTHDVIGKNETTFFNEKNKLPKLTF